jgi:hypothetical protein
MRSVRLVDVEGNIVIVEVPSDLLKGRIEQDNSKSQIEQSINQVIGVPVRLRCVLKGEHQLRAQPTAPRPEPSSVSDVGSAQPSSSPEEVEGAAGDAASEEDPMLEEALSLGAEIKNIE